MRVAQSRHPEERQQIAMSFATVSVRGVGFAPSKKAVLVPPSRPVKKFLTNHCPEPSCRRPALVVDHDGLRFLHCPFCGKKTRGAPDWQHTFHHYPRPHGRRTLAHGAGGW